LGVVTSDFNNDGWPEIYVANDSQPSALYRNNRDGTFKDIGIVAGCAYSQDGKSQAGMGVAVGDFDGDGWMDIFKTNFSEDTPNLYRNTGDAVFDEVTFTAGLGLNTRYLGWACGFLDLDNDGWLDIFLVNGHIYPEIERLPIDIRYRQRKIVYHNLGGGRFQDISGDLGEAVVARNSSRGAAFGDFDNDGDIDVAINPINGYPELLRCDSVPPSRGGNHWLTIRTVGSRSNRSGIGARIKCIAGNRQQVDEVRSGAAYLSQNDIRLHFGLGRATKAERVEISWPSGGTDVLENVAADQFIVVQEGRGVMRSSPSLSRRHDAN
jgi:hypothetical protein